jgi:hypothetical protein
MVRFAGGVGLTPERKAGIWVYWHAILESSVKNLELRPNGFATQTLQTAKGGSLSPKNRD